MKNTELENFVEMMGSVTKSHKYLGCSYSQLYKMRKGERALMPKYAKLIISKYPNLSLNRLIYPEFETSLTAA